MLRVAILQPKALPALTAISTAAAFRAGSAPGRPRQTMQTCLLAGAPNCVEHPQKILVRVSSWACTSSPITGSYFSCSAEEGFGLAGWRLTDFGLTGMERL